jgi:tRNA U34 5-methylaminomethyl-2-thiouridine-forming methyltransferase MnmC
MHKLIETGDGSLTLFHERLNETYHSIHGAVQESRHVFIDSGLQKVASKKKLIRILEVGFGTGLNALLSLEFVWKNPEVQIQYIGIEAFPLEEASLKQLSAPYSGEWLQGFQKIHSQPNLEPIFLNERFEFTPMHQDFLEYSSESKFDLIYYDAFGPPVQPEMWDQQSMKHCADLMVKEGIWVSYCAKGVVRRGLSQCGFIMERLPGPPGKREMLRGTFRPT